MRPNVTTSALASATAAILLPLGVTAVARADAPPKADGMTPLRTIEGISEYELGNGLRVLLFPDETKPTVTVNLTVLVGSRHEGYGEAGMAHLLEHMVFKGTPTRSDIPEMLKARGASFNGTTWFDRTNYYETLPASDENLEFALALEADRFVNSLIRGEDLASEMTVVRNEFERGENSPQRILRQRIQSAAYDWHGYGRSTIGNRADIERVPVANLKAFYEKYYRPENAVLVVAGRFDPAKAVEFISTHFAPLTNPDEPLPTTYTEEPAQDGERTVTLRRVGEVGLAGFAYHIPAGGSPEFPAVDVLAEALGSSPSGRIYKAVVEPGLAADAASYAFALHDPGLLQGFAEAADGNDPRDVLAKMLETVERVAEEPITEEEVARAKAKLLKQRELVANDSGRIAIELSDWAAMGDWRLFFLYRDRLEAVTVEDVNAAAAKYLQRENRTAGVFLPTKAPVSVPVAPTLDIAEQVDGYTGREVADLGEAFDVAPANVESRLTRTKAGDGDFDLLLLPKQNRGSTVSARVVLRYGNAEDLSGLATACEMLPRLMLRGTSTKTREQIQDELDRLQARLTGSGSAGAAAFAIKAKRETLPAVLDLLTEIVTDATLPADELEIMRKAELATLKARLVDPQALAPNAVRRRLSPWPSDDPRYVPTLEEEVARVESVTRDQLLRLKEEFLNGDAGAATFVGTFDVDDATSRVKTLLASLDGPVPYRRLGDRAPETLAAESLEINTPDKKNAVYFNATAFALSDTDADYPAVLLGNFILGGGSLSSRLGDRVRQQEGLSYGVGSGFSAQALDERAAFYIYAISNPENVPRLKQVVREELDRYLAEGPTDEEVEQARGGYLQQVAVERSDDGELARVLSATARDGRTMAFYETLEEALGGLTAEEVRAAFARYIDVDRLVLAVAGDFGKDD